MKKRVSNNPAVNMLKICKLPFGTSCNNVCKYNYPLFV